MIQVRTTRDVLWDACRSKACCRTTRVVLTGRDLVRLARAFELEPPQFAVHVPVCAGDSPGFVLEPRGPEYEVVLRKNGPISPTGAPCVFLVETNDGHARCGAGAARPMTCRAYPGTVSEGRLRIIVGGCDCRRWSLLDLGRQERELAVSAAEECAEHADIVRAWNADVREQGGSRCVGDYLRHLVETCR